MTTTLARVDRASTPTTAVRRPVETVRRHREASPPPPRQHLPEPPSRSERDLYVQRHLRPLTVASVLGFGGLVLSQVLLVQRSPWLWLLVPAFATTWIYYLVSTVVNLGSRSFDLEAHQRITAGARSAPRRPSVDVFLPVCGEPAEVLLNTWGHVATMVRHHGGSVTVSVLDDSPSDGLEAAARAVGFAYLRRPDRGWFKKAGNLRYAYGRTSGDLILVLDADFAPRMDLLDELSPYFAVEPRLGIVQSPQFFRVHEAQGWLERGAGAVQELFYRLVQVSRQQAGAAICVGSCALYRREALDSNGGTTLIEHSEDVHTGFDLRRHGWTLRYVPLPLATGLCPADVRSFFAQQYRWCAGSLSLLTSKKFWTTRLSARARLGYVSGFFYYLHTAVFAILGPLLPLVLLLVFPELITAANYVLVLPSIVYNLVVFPAWHRCRFGVEAWTAKLISGWAHAWAIADSVRGRRMGWVPTGGTAVKGRTGRVWVGLVGWTLPAAVLWVCLAGRHLVEGRASDFLPMFALGVFYLSVACQALLVDPIRESTRRASPRSSVALSRAGARE